MRYLLLVTAVCGQLLALFTAPSLQQSCLNENRECREVYGTCEKIHPEDLELCGNDELPDYNYDFFDCDICPSSSLNENNAAALRQNPIEIVSVEFISISIKFFSINITWNHAIDFDIGYKIFLRYNDFILDPLCVCNNERSTHIIDSFFYLPPSSMASMEVIIKPNVEVNNIPEVRKTIMLPSSCLDTHHYDSSTCGSPVLKPPQNITATQNCTTSMDNNTIVELKWDYKMNNKIFGPPSHYYIEVLNGTGLVLFRFVANGTKIVHLQLPYAEDYRFNVKAYSYCSGGGNYTNSGSDFGCGDKSEPVPLINCTPTTTTTTTTTTNRTTIPPLAPPIRLYVIIGCVVVFSLVLSITIIGIVCHILRRKKKKVPLFTPVFTPVPDCSVFVVHTPEDNSTKDLQTYVICPLKEYFDVATTGDKMCGDLIEWIELQVRQRSAILLVFTEEFCLEWEGHEDKSHVVKAARHLLTSAVAQELLDKYAIVVLDEDDKKKHIPNNHFLKSMGIYVLGRKKNEFESLYRFITKTKSFEHQDEPSAFGSSACSSDYASQSTDSTGVNLTPSNSEHTLCHPHQICGIKNNCTLQQSDEILCSNGGMCTDDSVCKQATLLKMLDTPPKLDKLSH